MKKKYFTAVLSISVLLVTTAPLYSNTVKVVDSIALKKRLLDKRFSIKLRNADAADVLRLMAQEFEFNLILPENINKKVTLDFKNVTLREALDAILSSSNLGYIQQEGIIRVDFRKKLNKELFEKIESESSTLVLEPLLTKSIVLNYIDKSSKGKNLKELARALEDLLSKRQGARISAVNSSQTLIVTDVKESLDKIIAMAKSIDIPTPQVRIDARIVEIEDRDSFDLGITWGGKLAEDGVDSFPKTYNLTGHKNQTEIKDGKEVKKESSTKEGSLVNLPSLITTGGIASLSVGALTDAINLDIALRALEEKRKLKVISRPSISVTQNQTADIHIGAEVPILKGTDVQTGQGIVASRKIGIRLKIVPQITLEENVFLSVEIEKSEKGDQWVLSGQSYDTITTKEVVTNVMIANEDTAVIGGLYSINKIESESRVPFFSKIPIIGMFFRSKSTSDSRKELLIFLTPTIIKQRMAALGK